MINILLFMQGENDMVDVMQKKNKNTKNNKMEEMLICKL